MTTASASQAHYASASLYVGDLHREVTEAMLYEVFNSVGPVASIRVCRDSVSRKSLCYAYVNYHSVADAERALDTLNYTHIKNVPCRIMWSHRDPGLRKSGNGNIFVKNLDKNIDNKALYDTFSLFGNILSCKVALDEFGKSKGYGFVHYEADEAAKTAIDRVNGMQIGSKTVYVGPFVKCGERHSDREIYFTNLYIKNIPPSWSEARLKEEFVPFGEVTSVAIKADMRGRHFGFVNFEEANSARAAIEGLDGKKLDPVDLQHLMSAEKKMKKEVTEGEKKEGEEKDGENGKSEEKKTNTEDDETKADEDEDGSESFSDKDHLIVARFQAKAERIAQLKQKFDAAQAERQMQQGVNLYIKNLDDTIEDNALRELFEPFGTITSAKVMYDERGRSRGFGFVCYVTADEATKAVTEMHLKLIENKPLYVGLAEKRDARQQRLLQRYRMPNMNVRPGGGQGGYNPNHIPPQVQFGNPQPMHHGYYGQGPNQGAQHRGGPMGSYPSMNPMGWGRGQPNSGGARGVPYGGAQGGMMGGGMPSYPMGMPMGGGPNGSMSRGPRGSMMMGNGQKMPNNKPPGAYGGGKFGGNHPGGGRAMKMDGGYDDMWNSVGRMTNMPPTQQTDMSSLQLTAEMLAGSPPHIQKQMLGEKLFPQISKLQPSLAGKITGMMLDMDNTELLLLLESENQLKLKVEEALGVLRQAQTPGA